MQHPAKGPGQGGGCCSLPVEQSSCLERNCFALPFTRGNARGANSAARCHMDTKCSPLAHTSPRCRGSEGRPPRLAFIPPALSSLSCCRPICPTSLWPCWAAYRLQTGRTGAGGSKGTLWPPLSISPFPAPAPLRPFPQPPAQLFCLGPSVCGFPRSEICGKKAQLYNFTPNKKTSPSPLPTKG